MDTTQASALRELLLHGQVASLGTLHNGEPAVSMVPYALLPGTGIFVVHVSRLATHTKDMERHAGVSLMVLAEQNESALAQARPRASISGSASRCTENDDGYQAAREKFLDKHPSSEPMFGFGDFSIFLIRPRALRFVGGFGQAWSATEVQFQQAMARTA
ncbi:MAG: pyridoxamine 5'-phosphate oxidase family protein [Ideonella sp.]|nr:pyridoxamine 5'-phosphate oxidase family protein [Ideonella sp.]